jgi:hypothetical protein
MDLLSLAEISAILRGRGVHAPTWTLRKLVDRHFPHRIRRFGLTRTLPESLLPELEALCRRPRRRGRKVVAP